MRETRLRDLSARDLLRLTLPRVYAVGPPRTDRFARLCAAILYAGPGAKLSHGTAGHWRGLLRYASPVIHVTSPRKIPSIPGIVVHHRRAISSEIVNGLPCTTVAQTMLDVAHTESDAAVTHALGQLSFSHQLDVDALWAATGRGILGSSELRAAISTYSPESARLNEGIERELYQLLIDAHFEPLPEPNVQLEPGLIVDFLFRDRRTVAETDGRDNHDSSEQQLRDARRDMRCRELGLQVLHYRTPQIREEPERVIADLRRHVDERAP